MIDMIVDDGVLPLASPQNIEHAVKVSCLVAKNITQPTVCIRFSSDEVVKQLNAQWRDKDKVTDVLSFPMQEEDSFDADESLGDIILAVPFVQAEAKRLNLAVEAHSMHLIVHATLHLLGYDHIADDEAQVMQQLENRVMLELGLHMPYPEEVSL